MNIRPLREQGECLFNPTNIRYNATISVCLWHFPLKMFLKLWTRGLQYPREYLLFCCPTSPILCIFNQLSLPAYCVDLELGGLQKNRCVHLYYSYGLHFALQDMLPCGHANVSFDIPGHNKQQLYIVYTRGLSLVLGFLCRTHYEGTICSQPPLVPRMRGQFVLRHPLSLGDDLCSLLDFFEGTDLQCGQSGNR